jgi:hypothetical protein
MGINASTGTGTSQTGLPALDNYLNNVVKGAAYRQPAISPAPPTTTGSPNGNSMTNAPPFVQAFANGAPNGGVETNAYWNASPYLQQFANDLAANPQANPQYTTFFQDQANLPNNGGGGMASGGMVPRRADAGYVPGGLGENPGDDVYNLEVTTDPATPPAMEGTPAAVGLAPPGATVGQAAALRANASGIPAAPTRMHDTGEPMAQGSGLHRAQADPWLALAEAGFGMAAGRSPHALENIGAGANEGVKRYIQQKQEANKENLQADIWGGRLGVQQDSNAIKQQRADSLDKVAEARVPLLQAQAAKYTQQAVNGGKPEIFKYAGDNDDGLPIFVGNHGTQKLGDIAIGLTANQRSLEAGREAQHGDRQAALQQKTSQFLQTQQGRDLDRRIRAQLGDNAEAGRVVGRISMLVASGINPEKAEAQVAAETKRAQQRAKPGSASVLIPPTGPSAPIGAPPPSGAPPLSEILGP